SQGADRRRTRSKQACRHRPQGPLGDAVTRWTGWLVIGGAAAAAAWSGVAPHIRFTEMAGKAGLSLPHRTRRYQGPHADVLRMFTSGGAAAAAGDYDGDGFEDLFVTDSDAGRPNHLYHNNGNLTFTDVAEKAGVAGGNDPLSIVADAL